MLDTCATIEEVRAASKGVRINDTEDHYLACDRTGAVAVIECLDGRLLIRTGKGLPVRALANAPYQKCLDHGTMKAAAPPDPYHSLNRFSRLADGLAAFKGGRRRAAVGYAFELLSGVAASNTRWSFVCDTGARVFYLKSYKNPKLRFVDLKRIDFSCERPTGMLDAHADARGRPHRGLSRLLPRRGRRAHGQGFGPFPPGHSAGDGRPGPGPLRELRLRARQEVAAGPRQALSPASSSA
ncbi:MAG: hypothetical protein MZU91_11445 [Desulfosudis oleivorans]|nr:hypothetical protein [Desulfosudis oleivorans]